MSNKITDYLLEVQKIIDSISKEDISNAIQILNEARLAGKKIFIVGNGGSASTATHFACDLNKYTSVEGEKRFRALSLEDNIPLLTALVNDEGFHLVLTHMICSIIKDKLNANE